MSVTSQGRLGGVSAIAAAFSSAAQEGRAALITYVMAGYPSPGETLDITRALAAGGADLIELGVPFSDPVADGPAIQKAGYAALAQGVTPGQCLDMVRAIRQDGVVAPLLLMGYYNPVLSYGPARFVADCRRSGVDGLIVPDLPPEEAGELDTACAEQGLALVFLVAPTTSPARIETLCQATSGFLYVVRRLGTTGADRADEAGLAAQMALVRRHATTPVALGFGISSPSQVAEAATLADGVIIGSAIVGLAAEGSEAVRAYLSTVRPALARGRGLPGKSQ